MKTPRRFIVDLSNDVVGKSINLEAHNGPDAGLSEGFAGFETATTGETPDANYPYMYHCHMISHEDAGLMGQFVVR